MAIYDISLPITSSMPVWPGDPTVSVLRTPPDEEGAVVSRLEMGTHSGTHVDAPAHFLPEGAGVDAIDLDALIGPAVVVSVLGVESITAALLQTLSLPADAPRVLFQSGRGRAALSEDGAELLVQRRVRLIGIDSLSVAPANASGSVHRLLLEAGIPILEGLDLSLVRPGKYRLCCLPLKIAGGDGAPARAVLIDD